MRLTDEIKRWWQRKGFGIQSKSDFAFLHNVIREPLPYYAYNVWLKKYSTATQQEQRFARLLLRISNNLQPSTVHIHGTHTPLIAEAISYGCKGAAINESDNGYFKLQYGNIPVSVTQGVVIEFVTDTTRNSAVVLTDIHTHNAGIWQQLLAKRTVTYDMRHIGIAIIQQGRYPEHYYI